MRFMPGHHYGEFVPPARPNCRETQACLVTIAPAGRASPARAGFVIDLVCSFLRRSRDRLGLVSQDLGAPLRRIRSSGGKNGIAPFELRDDEREI